ncbi:MAG: carbohydrate ABC transporter permease [Firmicutes bacterium]|nr:carbohydrate ABC transporter permease [Bacillota bacterium]
MKIRYSKAEYTFKVINYIFLTLLGISILLPFWEIIKVSFSHPLEVGRIGYRLWPRETSLDGYIHVLNNEYLWLGYKNTIIRIIVGVSIYLILIVLTSYPLSKKNLPHRNFFTVIFVFTMFFSGGLIPEYLLISQTLRLSNTIWALTIPGAISTYTVLIVRNYFMSLPAELEESAKLDGASDFLVLLRIIIPLSMPILATITLWAIVGHWNAWFDCIIYIRNTKKYVLQAILRRIIIDSMGEFYGSGTERDYALSRNINVEVIKACTLIIATLPIMMIYPFLQKYFIKGILIGSLKG